MGKRLLAVWLTGTMLVLVLVLPAWSYNRKYTSGSTGLSVTTATQYVEFSHHSDLDGDGSASGNAERFLADTVVIHNANAAAGSPCYYLLVNPGAATVLATTTNGSRIEAASTRVEEFEPAGGQGWQGVAFVSAAAETCTAYVDAYGSVPTTP